MSLWFVSGEHPIRRMSKGTVYPYTDFGGASPCRNFHLARAGARMCRAKLGKVISNSAGGVYASDAILKFFLNGLKSYIIRTSHSSRLW